MAKLPNAECGILGCSDIGKCLVTKECLHSGEPLENITETEEPKEKPKLDTFDMECKVLGCTHYGACESDGCAYVGEVKGE